MTNVIRVAALVAACGLCIAAATADLSGCGLTASRANYDAADRIQRDLALCLIAQLNKELEYLPAPAADGGSDANPR